MRDIDALPEELERKLPGRPPGALNRFTRVLKNALLDAAILSDFAKDPNNPDAPNSLTQYCLTMIHKYPDLYFQQLCRLIPKEINTSLKQDTNVNVTYRTIAEVKQTLLDEGMTPKQIATIEAMMPETGKPLDDEVEND
jgi:hypothetical protein